jgi:hypothetical protein
MRAEIAVGVGAALLVSALAGVEWWAEHQWHAEDFVVRPAEVAVEPGLPDTTEADTPDASASPRLSR